MQDNAKPRLIPQAHGGALLSGRVKGGKGGPGRPSNELRAQLREGLAGAVPSILAAAADENHPDHKWAVDMCAKYGLGLRHELEALVEHPEPPPREELMHEIIRALPRIASEG